MTAPTLDPSLDTTRSTGGRSGLRRVRWWPAIAVHAVIAFVFPFLSAPGDVAADTKVYLYLDPGRLLSRAGTMWDPTVAAGTVPHQNIGYLFPMGPYYWVAERIGVPDWIAQRFWVGLASMAAAIGVHLLLRTLDPSGTDLGPGARLVAAAAYQLSPYLLPYVSRHSVLLGAWAALPWLCAFTARALRDGGWRWPAGFAIVLALVGSINASSLVFVLLGPAIWLGWALATKRATLRTVVAVSLRLGVLSLGVSLWWIVGLRIQAAYGIDVLRYTESPVTVAGTSTALESIRQLGYWYFYGSELVFPFTPQAAGYQEHPWLLVAGFAIPTLALAAATFTRWRYRALAMVFVAVGLAVAVGAHPWGGPPLFGQALQRFFETASGLALRSTPRAVPLLALGVALLLGAGVAAVGRALPSWRPWVVAGTVALLVVNLTPWFTGGLIASAQRMPNDVPAWWHQVADEVSRRGDATRVLVLPGTDFAAYRWGFALEPVLPGLTDRASLQRENVPYGTPGTVDLLLALDRRLQEGVLDPDAVAPLARRFAAGDILFQHDLAYERYPTPRPRDLWTLEQGVAGLGPPEAFGPSTPNQPTRALRDPQEYADLGRADPPALALYRVDDALPIVRAASGAPVVIAGNGEGMVDGAAVGLLDRPGVALYSAALDQAGLDAALAQGADLVVTDTNRERALRWGGLRDNHGPTVAPGESALTGDPYAQDLTPFPGQGEDTRTVAQRTGVARVEATAFGQPLWYTPEDRPANAIDGDPHTDWRVVAFESVAGQRLRITLDHPVTTDRLTLLQTITEPRQRIDDVRLRFDGGSPLPVTLDEGSRAEPGQEITFPSRTFQELEIELGHTSAPFDVGIAEVRIPGVEPEELLRLPTDLTDAVGTDSIDHRLVALMTRERSDPRNEFRRDEELTIRRIVTVPTERSFALGGTARLDADGADTVLDAALGYRSVAEGGIETTASGRMPGDPTARARAAFDGDPTTAWRSPLDPVQPWVAARLPAAATIDRLDLQVVADGRHSVPTQLTLTTSDGQIRTVAVPPVVERPDTELATAAVTVAVDPPLVSSDVRVTVTGYAPRYRVPRGQENPAVLPVAIAEVGLPGVRSEAPPTELPPRCRPGLVQVDGAEVGLRIAGTQAEALEGAALDAQPCEVPAGALDLTAGEHTIRTQAAAGSGFAVDQVVLASDQGGAALPLGRRGRVPAPADAATTTPPAVVVEDQRADHLRLQVDDATGPFELVLGQSLSDGWRARATGATLGSAAPRLVDGYANGWSVTPTGGPITITLDWQPQRLVPPALALSAVSLLACIALALWPRRRTLRTTTDADPDADARSTGDAQITAVGRRHPLTDTVPVSRRKAWLVALVTTVGALFVMTWWAAPIAGAIVLAALLARRLRPLLLAGPLLLAVAGAGVVAGQVLFAPLPGYGWPGLFDPLDTLVWLAVVVVLVELALPRASPGDQGRR